MIEQRMRGCLLALMMTIGLANGMLFLFYLMVEERFAIYGLVSDLRILVYLCAIPVSLVYSSDQLRESLRRVRAPSLWHSGLTALRIALIQAINIFGIYFILKDVGLSRFFMLGYLAFGLVLNLFLIYALPTLITRFFFKDEHNLRAILYGFGELPDDLRAYVANAEVMGIQVIGYYADQKLNLPKIEWLGNTREVMECEGGRKRLRVELVFAYRGEGHEEQFRDGIDLCMRRGARVHVYSNLSSTFLDPVKVVADGKVLFFTFHEEPLQNPINQFMKRVVDVFISLPVVVLVLPPLTALVWLVQRIQSPGPVFFKQTRYGMNRRPFTIYKYRTMHVHDRKLEGIQATKGDSRIFGFGSFLRKTSLDEFPQFLNALRGSMSVVGPRPHLTLHDDQFEKAYRRYRSRHYVKPGITGLAQVTGYRGEMPDEAAVIGRVQRDLEYITQWSIGTEIYIVLKTAWQVLFPPKSAY
ncbi:MAG: exopolysaccharide biosynthesis polyprenyl glycosylphosphotransferase [Puniceicoccaceae bacterium]